MRLIGLTMAMTALAASLANAAPPSETWDQPVAALAGQIADLLGPGQARLTVRNISSIPSDEIPAIEHLLELDLKARGVTASEAESASTVRVTLSESARARLWVAQIVEGDQTHVAMVNLPPVQSQPALSGAGLVLRSEAVMTSQQPVLAALETAEGLLVLEPEALVLYQRAAGIWQQQQRASIAERTPLARDPHGVLIPSADGAGFEAWLVGMRCAGTWPPAGSSARWTVDCAPSDDPWTLVPAFAAAGPAQVVAAHPAASTPIALKAFYNATRNYFTGVVSPNLGVSLPAFYSAAVIGRPAGNAGLLIDGIDSRVELVENGALEPVSGARDWGSDLGVLRSGCGGGTEIVASGSGQAPDDSLRAYELAALEVVPVSAPLGMNGTITAIWSAPDLKSIYAVVRKPANEYEVERVSGLCN
jgi:hypothetical protein